MKIDLTGKTALITGSTQGIGFAIALGLARAGATVVVNGRSDGRTEAAVARLCAAAPQAAVRGVVADVGTAEGCELLVRAELSADILVNNAGIFDPVDFFEAPDSLWQRFMDVNVMSGIRLSRAYLQGMAQRGWGRVIFVSSESGLKIPADMIHYGVTKNGEPVAFARSGKADGRHRGHRQCDPSRSDPFGRIL